MPLLDNQVDLSNRATAISDAAHLIALRLLGPSPDPTILLGMIAALMRMTVDLGDRIEPLVEKETGARFPWRPGS
jgi:hypothetical protein